MDLVAEFSIQRRLLLGEAIIMALDPVDILLIEGNRNDEMLSMLAFTERGIDVVKVVRDGAEALEYIFCTGTYSDRKAKNPRLILLDLKLPKVNSIEVLRQIRYNPRTTLVPVVVLASSKEECDVVQGYKLG